MTRLTLRERIFGRLEAAPLEGEERALTGLNVPPVMITQAPGNVTPHNALSVANVYAAVRTLADAMSSLPLITYRRLEDGGRERAAGRIAELLQRPAPATTQANLIGTVATNLQTFGNAYVGKLRGAEGGIEQLASLPPDRVVPEIRSGEPVYTFTNERGRQQELTTADVIHVRSAVTTPDGLLGLSPVKQARAALGLDAQLVEHAGNLLANNGRPSGLLKLGGGESLTRDQVQDVRDAWDIRHRGTEGAGEIAIVGGPAEFQAVELPADDMQFIEQRKLSATEIARIFRIPAWLLSAETGDSLTYSNAIETLRYFVTFSLKPWLNLIESALSNDRDLAPGGTFHEFLLDDFLRADSKTRAEVFQIALDPERGWLRREEVRRLENLPTEPEGDLNVN